MEVRNVMMRSCEYMSEAVDLYVNYAAPKMRGTWSDLVYDAQILRMREGFHMRTSICVTSHGTWLHVVERCSDDGMLEPDSDERAALVAADWWRRAARSGELLFVAVIVTYENSSCDVSFYDIAE